MEKCLKIFLKLGTEVLLEKAKLLGESNGYKFSSKNEKV